MNGMQKTVLGSIACFLCVFLVILSLILIFTSLNQIEADEIGIEYNANLAKKINEEKVFTEGRYLLTPASSVFIYKRTLQTLDYTNPPIACLSHEGLQMSLSITCQYQIIQDRVFDVLKEYGLEEDWKTYLDSITRDTLKDVCSQYTADDYFHKRAEIERTMHSTLKEFYEDSHAYATPTSVQLRNVQHPKAFVDANQQKQETEQEKDRLIREREELLTKETTKLLNAQENAKIKLIDARGDANGIIEKAQSLAPAENKKWEERGEALTNIWSQMEDTDINQFIDQYLKYSILTSQGDKKIISLSTGGGEGEQSNILLSLLDLAKL